jgi:hypothetical protein
MPLVPRVCEHSASSDFCAGAEVYAARDTHMLLGVLVSEQAVETAEGRKLDVAVNLKSVVDGRLVALWRSRSEIMRGFVRDDDPALRDCRWFAAQTTYRLRDTDISPLIRLRFHNGWISDQTQSPANPGSGIR